MVAAQVQLALGQRGRRGPWVPVSWALMVWMLPRIFFWWPMRVIPKARTSLRRKGGAEQLGLGGWEPWGQGYTHALELPASSAAPHPVLVSPAHRDRHPSPTH